MNLNQIFAIRKRNYVYVVHVLMRFVFDGTGLVKVLFTKDSESQAMSGIVNEEDLKEILITKK